MQGRECLKQLHLDRPHADLQLHLVSSITALGAGKAKHNTGTYSPFFTIQPFSSMGGRDGHLYVYDLSRSVI